MSRYSGPWEYRHRGNDAPAERSSSTVRCEVGLTGSATGRRVRLPERQEHEKTRSVFGAGARPPSGGRGACPLPCLHLVHRHLSPHLTRPPASSIAPDGAQTPAVRYAPGSRHSHLTVLQLRSVGTSHPTPRGRRQCVTIGDAPTGHRRRRPKVFDWRCPYGISQEKAKGL